MANRAGSSMKGVAGDPALAKAMGDRIRVKRESLRMKPFDVEKATGLGVTSIYAIETGRRAIGGRIILLLAKALNMSPNEILGWESE